MTPNKDILNPTLCWDVDHSDQKLCRKALIVVRYLLLHITPAVLAMLYSLGNSFFFYALSVVCLVSALGALYLHYNYAGGNERYNVRYELKDDALSQTYWLKPLPDKVRLLFRGYQVLFIVFLVAASITMVILTTTLSFILPPGHFATFVILVAYLLMLIKAFNPNEIEKVHEKTIHLNESGRWWLKSNHEKVKSKLLNRKLSSQMIIIFNDSETSAQFVHLVQEQYPQVKTIQSTIMRWLV